MKRVRTRIATDLHDDMAPAIRRSPSPAKWRTSTLGKAGEPMERIGALYRELLDSIRDIVWEVRALKMLVDGHNYKTAAVELSVSLNTIFPRAPHLRQAARLTRDRKR